MEKRIPAVSVIIPLYNVEKYIAECVESAIKQTLRNIEIICVDDGSPDRSAQIVEEYAKKDDRIVLIRKPNGGQSSARNAALDAARGEYVYFLDSDDYIDLNTLEELYKTAKEQQLDDIYFSAVAFFESDKIKKDNQNFVTYYKNEGSYDGVHTGQMMMSMMRKNREFRPSVCLQMFRREVIEAHGIRFCEGIIHEDNLFTFQFMLVAKRVVYTSKEYYHRRVRGDSTMTTQKSMKNVEGYMVCYAKMLEFMSRYEIEPDAFDAVTDYLYNSVYGNARRIYRELEMGSGDIQISHSDSTAKYLFEVMKLTTDTEGDRSYIKEENKKLRNQRDEQKRLVDEYRTSWAYRIGNIITFVPRMAVLALRGIKKRGIGYTLRVAGVKLKQKFGGSSPLVSVILPVYNVSEFIGECISSLQSQTLSRIEIIAVDDGSTDDSLEQLRAMAADDKRIKVFTQQNKYAGAARNLGLSHATGEYVIFLDSDDFFARGLLSEAYNAAAANRADMVLFGAKHYNNVTGEYKEAKWLLNEKFAPAKQPFNYKDAPDNLYRISTPCPWTKMFRREFVLKSGLQFQTTQNSNDLFFTYSALAMAESIVTVNKPLVYYRVGLQNSLQSTKKKNPFCFCEAYRAWQLKLKELGVYETLRRSYVNAALSGCLYNLRTQPDDEAKKRVFDKLREETLEQLELTGFEKSYYFSAENYDDMMRIMSMSFEQYLAQEQ